MADLRDRIGRAVPPVGKRAARGMTRALASATSGARALPDFLVIGAQRAGTTTLYHYLVRHPSIGGAVLDKEIHFFDLAYVEGIDHYRAAFPLRSSLARAERRTGVRHLVGEATPYYLFHPLVPERVARDLPDVKLLAVLRDPVDRAWSQYRHEVDLGYEDLSFGEAIDREERRLAGEEERLVTEAGSVSFEHQHHSYVARGRYAEQLERWYARFPRERLLLVRAEDLFQEPGPVFERVLRFLGVAAWHPAAWRPYNAASVTTMAPQTRERLRAYFAPWNARLSELTGTDFGWRA